MPGMMMPIDYLAELAGTDFSPDPSEFYLPEQPAPEQYFNQDPVTAAWGPPTEVTPQGYQPQAAAPAYGAQPIIEAEAIAPSYFAPTAWQEDIRDPVDYQGEATVFLPPTVPREYE
jgi:hypothetical protein